MILDLIKDEFKDFAPPHGFTGGRFLSQYTMKGAQYYAHIRSDGAIAKIEVVQGDNTYFLKPAA